MGFLLLVGNSVLADSMVVNVTGQILPASCTVQPINNVNLGDIRDVDMFDVGDVSSSVPFQIKLTDCPATLTKVTAQFAGAQDAINKDLYANIVGNGFATGLGIQLLDADHGDVKIPPAGEIQTSVVNSNAIFNLKARAVTTTVNPMTGDIETCVTVTFIYQ